MGSKKKNSSHGEKSQKQNQQNGKQQNGVKHRKQSPKPDSPGGKKQSQKNKAQPQPSASETKKSDKTKTRSSSSSCKWILVVLLSSLVAGGAVWFASPEVQNLVDDIMLKHFHPDILSVVHNFIEVTKSVVPSKTESNTKVHSTDEDGKTVREESVVHTDRVPKESAEQAKPKDKEKEPDPESDRKTREQTDTKTKPADKSDAEQSRSKKSDSKAQPKEKEKGQAQPDKKKKDDTVLDKEIVQEEKKREEKVKVDESSVDSKTKSKDVPKAEDIHKTTDNQKQQERESKPKLNDKIKQEEQSKEGQQKASDQKLEKQDDESKQGDKKIKKETESEAQKTKTEAKPGDKVKKEEKIPKEVPMSEDAKKTAKPETKTKPSNKETKSGTVEKSKDDTKSKDIPEVKSSQKQESKQKLEDKEQKQETVTKPSDKKTTTETAAKPKDDKKSKDIPDVKSNQKQESKPESNAKKLKQESKPKTDEKLKQETITKQDGRHTEQKQDQKPADSESDKPADVENKEKQEKQTSGDKLTKSKSKTKAAYSKASITNNADNLIRKSLDEADKLFEQKQYETALEKFNIILKKYPRSPRALYGKALTLNELAEQYRSNEILEKCISILSDILDLTDVPDDLYKIAGRKLSDRQQFRGWGGKAAKTMLKMSERFPSDMQLKNELGVSYLMIGRNDPAQAIFEEVLKMDPSNGFAMVHLGFIVKTVRDDLDRGIQLLADGIATSQPGTNDGRFYFHLGDALQRKNRTEDAYRYYREGAAKKIFLSEHQRSLYNVDYLTGRPWWTQEETGYSKYIKLLEDNWEVIRDEGLAQLDAKMGAFLPEDENLREKGSWKQFSLYSQGRKNRQACEKAPRTCALIDQIPDARACSRGQTKFSVMHPGVHVWPHCGPTNCRIRAHLGLVIPPGPKIRVVNDTREWKEGKVIIFDDSFEHEVWHDGNQTRLVLIVDFWHPELTADLKRTLAPI